MQSLSCQSHYTVQVSTLVSFGYSICHITPGIGMGKLYNSSNAVKVCFVLMKVLTIFTNKL